MRKKIIDLISKTLARKKPPSFKTPPINPVKKQEILQKLKTKQTKAPVISHDKALQKLLNKGFSSKDLQKRLDRLNITDLSAVITYKNLHGIDILDASNIKFDPTIKTVTHPDLQAYLRHCRMRLQVAEILLQNMIILMQNASKDIAKKDFDKAAEKQLWLNQCHTSLLDISTLLKQESIPKSEQHSTISITDSPTLKDFEEAFNSYQHAIRKAGLTSPAKIGSKTLADSATFVRFNTFINAKLTTVFIKQFFALPLPITKPKKMSQEEFYKSIVDPEAIVKMVRGIRQKGDNHFTQFRCFHQTSEEIVCVANEEIRHVIEGLLDDKTPLAAILPKLSIAKELITFFSRNFAPILRSMPPSEYQKIRKSLFATSGSHSHHIRKGLFNTHYPLLVESALERLPEDLESVVERASNQEPEALQQRQLMQQLQAISDALFLSRDLHMVFIPLHLGESPVDKKSTASISGSPNAAQTVKKMKEQAAYSNPITPITKALGLDKEDVSPTLTSIEEFTEHMAHQTAEMNRESSKDVQQRVHGASPKRR